MVSSSSSHHHSLSYTCPCSNLSLRITNQREVALPLAHYTTYDSPPQEFAHHEKESDAPQENISVVKHILESQRIWRESPYYLSEHHQQDSMREGKHSATHHHSSAAADSLDSTTTTDASSHAHSTTSTSLNCITGNSLIGVETQIEPLLKVQLIHFHHNSSHKPTTNHVSYKLYTCKNCNLKCFLQSIEGNTEEGDTGEFFAIQDSVLLSPDMTDVPDYSRVFRVRVLPQIAASDSKQMDYTKGAIRESHVTQRERIPKQCLELQKEMQRRLLTAKREMERRIERFAEIERRCFERMMRRTCEVERRLLFAQILSATTVSDHESSTEDDSSQDSHIARSDTAVDSTATPQSEESKSQNAPLNNDERRDDTISDYNQGASLENTQIESDEESARDPIHHQEEAKQLEKDEPPTLDINPSSAKVEVLSTKTLADKRNQPNISVTTGNQNPPVLITTTHTSDDEDDYDSATTPKTPVSDAENKEDATRRNQRMIGSPSAGSSPPVRRRLFARKAGHSAQQHSSEGESASTDDSFAGYASSPPTGTSEQALQDAHVYSLGSPTSENDFNGKETAVFELEGDEFSPMDSDYHSSSTSEDNSDSPSSPAGSVNSATGSSPLTKTGGSSLHKPHMSSPLAKRAIQISSKKQSNGSEGIHVASSVPVNITRRNSVMNPKQRNYQEEFDARYIMEQPAASYIERYADLRDQFFAQRRKEQKDQPQPKKVPSPIDTKTKERIPSRELPISPAEETIVPATGSLNSPLTSEVSPAEYVEEMEEDGNSSPASNKSVDSTNSGEEAEDFEDASSR